jgi:hypothetical protein
MITLKRLFTVDYERDGPSFYDPKQPKWSLVRAVFVFIGAMTVVKATLSMLVDTPASLGPFGSVWWGFLGVIAWWRDSVGYECWLYRKREKNVSLAESQGIRP